MKINLTNPTYSAAQFLNHGIEILLEAAVIMCLTLVNLL